ncbi:MAG: thiosulfohydrolase SoxB [Hyphomicrobiaceae bacterium]
MTNEANDPRLTTRRDILEMACAAGVLLAGSGRVRAQALSGSVRQEDLLRFEPLGQVTLLHTTDIHAQLNPIYFREPSTNLGVGPSKGRAPHLTDRAFLREYAIDPGSHRAYMLTAADHDKLAHAWGRVGGMDRIATLVRAIRAERGDDKVLLLDGGDALQGSYTALATKGADMIRALDKLGVAAMTGHWEFTLGERRIHELFGDRVRQGASRAAFLAGNVFDNEFDEPIFHPMRFFEKGGVRIAVIGQAFPYTPVANPAWMIPKWSMGIRESEVQRNVDRARAKGAHVVVLLSHNGFDVDRKMAGRVSGLDVILSGHTHDALPRPLRIGKTLIVASGSHGKFLSRLDLDVRDKRVVGYRYALIPVLSDAIAPDPEMAALIADIRRPHEDMLSEVLAVTETMLYRRDNFSGPLDDLVMRAMLEGRGADIALSPGFRWGPTLLAGQPITWEDVYSATAITYPTCYRTVLTGRRIKEILEDVADNLFNPDPYYQQGGDMVRVGGMAYEIDIERSMGQRIGRMTLTKTGKPVEADRSYVVAGWGAVAQGIVGPPIWDVVADYLRANRVIRLAPGNTVKLGHSINFISTKF